MRDAHQLTGPRAYHDDLDAAHAAIRRLYPGAQRHGSVGAYSWVIGALGEATELVVAEAWVHPTRPGWWVRVRQPAGNHGA